MLQQNGARPLPFFFVGKTLTNERILRFAQTKHPVLSEKISKPDTRSIWYTKEHITFLLEEMEKANADGLRIYFGAYGEKDIYNGQLCLLMVMTKPDEVTGGHADITLEDQTDFQLRSAEGSTPRDFNVGSPCPPMCDDIKEG